MKNYIIRRLIQTVIVLIFLSFITYVLMGLMPGDPLDVACSANPDCTPENLELMKTQLGLDKPIIQRYFGWLGNVLQGDLGFSRTYRLPVADILLPRLGNTVILGLLVLILSFCIAIPLGIFSSLKANSKMDYLLNFVAFLGISAPSFWLGLMFIIFFSVKLGWFPAGGVSSLAGDSMGMIATFFDRLKYLALPVLTLSALTIAGWIRYTRSSMLEVLRMDYIRTAKAKGLPKKDVVVKHGLRNALLSIVTIIALEVPRIVSGAVITETVFSYQGIGKLMLDSIIGNDFNVAMFSFVITCVAVLVMNLVADIAYAVLDPRIKLK